MKEIIEEIKYFEILIKKIFKERGFDCTQYKDSYLKRRILVRLRVNNLGSYGDYIEYLDNNPEEYAVLMDTLTINVTEFFRDPSVYKFLEEKIIPDLKAGKQSRNQKFIRVWSAGCAAGEEPYSIAMVLAEVMGNELENFFVSVYGTDIDSKSINTAKAGEYSIEKAKNIPEKYIKKYFVYNDKLLISPKIKSLCRFKFLDLFKDNPLLKNDIVFCRNVVIYFANEQRDKLFNKIYSSLNNNGYLIIGKSEVLTGEISKKFKIIESRERVYSKIPV
jgi:chemotaxis protein methyltransferase CheR